MHNQFRCIWFIAVWLFANSCASNKVSKNVLSIPVLDKTDTIEGFFLYEVNVPSKCYSRFDQIEQGNNLILFDSVGVSAEIKSVYDKGVFFYLYQPVITEFIMNTGKGIAQKKESIKAFNLSIHHDIHKEDSLYHETLYFDKQRILSYKKLYAKFCVKYLGYLKQLIPVTKDYKCCYTNQVKSIKSYFVTEVISFTLF